uniref:Uncharacterized protein n=1 Tax=Parascaris equorum TaxID=6256 RepID=A0A914RTK8_PAREQ
MTADFEALPSCNGPQFTRFWLRDYRAHLATEAEEFAEDAIQDPAPFSTEDIKALLSGVFGFITLWGIDLDPISMATLIMSIGLSVDFPAHITFHYYRTGLDPSFTSIKERMLHSLIAIGFPLLQCSASTILFVLCLLLVPCYMGEVSLVSIIYNQSINLCFDNNYTFFVDY